MHITLGPILVDSSGSSDNTTAHLQLVRIHTCLYPPEHMLIPHLCTLMLMPFQLSIDVTLFCLVSTISNTGLASSTLLPWPHWLSPWSLFTSLQLSRVHQCKGATPTLCGHANFTGCPRCPRAHQHPRRPGRPGRLGRFRRPCYQLPRLPRRPHHPRHLHRLITLITLVAFVALVTLVITLIANIILMNAGIKGEEAL